MDTLRPGARRIVERVQEELGQTCSENLHGRSSCLPEVHGADADHSVHRKPTSHQEDPHPPRSLPGAIKTSTEGATQGLSVRLAIQSIPGLRGQSSHRS